MGGGHRKGRQRSALNCVDIEWKWENGKKNSVKDIKRGRKGEFLMKKPKNSVNPLQCVDPADMLI